MHIANKHIDQAIFRITLIEETLIASCFDIARLLLNDGLPAQASYFEEEVSL